MSQTKTIEDRVREFGASVKERLESDFTRIGAAYPPNAMALLGFKHERILEVWIRDLNSVWKHLKTYPILAASGDLGPKLRQGDRQVPEGIYGIELLNPNSRFHLSLRVNYPNAVDRAQGRKDGRTNLGSDIMIHGNACSIGCLAMGDSAAEELFIMAALCGIQNIKVILSPVDFTVRSLPKDGLELPDWTEALYGTIRTELASIRGIPAQ